jgi:hypothetical protein
MSFTTTQLKEIANRSVYWHAAGLTPSQKLLRVVDDEGETAALVPIHHPDTSDGMQQALATAQLLSTAGSLYSTAYSILQWQERQPPKTGLPVPVRRRLIATLARAAGQV